MSTPTKPAASGTVIVVALVAAFCFVVAAVVALAIAAPAGSDIGTLATALLGSLGSLVATIVTLAKVASVDSKVEYLANGGTDAKYRAAAVDVLKPELLREDYVDEQLDADRAHRAAGPAGAKATS